MYSDCDLTEDMIDMAMATQVDSQSEELLQEPMECEEIVSQVRDR